MMVAEDMAEYLNRVPGSFFVLGAMPDGVSWAEPHHSPRFDIDERALPWAWRSWRRRRLGIWDWEGRQGNK